MIGLSLLERMVTARRPCSSNHNVVLSKGLAIITLDPLGLSSIAREIEEKSVSD